MCCPIERYTLTRRCGDLSDHPEFQPWATPAEMLAFGVFEGKYLNSTQAEYPSEWFAEAKLSNRPDPVLNCFGVKSRMALSEWQARGWIHPQDPFGWFQWYCRYYLGRRSDDDERQIRRWASFGARHGRQVYLLGCGDINRRRRQRQALLQWSHDPFPDCR